MKSRFQKAAGFSLIEVLVVIAIIAMLIGLALPNYLGARERARDSKRKTELSQLKTALRMYYNDYAGYPTSDSGILKACGLTGKLACPVCTSAEFAAGGTDGCSVIYMKKLPQIGTGPLTDTFLYFQCSDGDDFRLVTSLENKSDIDIASSQTRCPAACGAGLGPTEYVLCAD